MLDADFLRRQTPESFHTPRLRLEKIAAGHAPLLRDSVLRNRAALRYIDWAHGEWDAAEALRFCRNSREAMDREGRFLTYLVFEHERVRDRQVLDAAPAPRGRYVGLLDLHGFDFVVPACQIGYVGDAALQGRGLMREAAWALVRQAHAWGVHRIEAWCDARNERSVRFAQGLGFRFEGRLHDAARDIVGELCDQIVLARLANDPLPPPTLPGVWPGALQG